MNCKILVWFFPIVVLNFHSCSKEVSFKQNDVEKRLVVNGLIEPDSMITVRISSKVSIVEDQIPSVVDAKVKLSVNGNFTEDLRFIGDGYYASVVRAVPGSIYALEITAPGYPDVSAIDTLPIAVPIQEGSMERGLTYDEYGDPHIDVKFSFQDRPGADFYEFMFLSRHTKRDSNPYHIGFQWPMYIADPVLKNDSELEYEPFTFVFSDALIAGQNYHMENKFSAGAISGSFDRPIIPEKSNGVEHIILRHVSHAYYRYRKSWIIHSNNQQTGQIFDDPLRILTVGSPSPMYSNIEGGLGIFAAFNTTYYSVER